MLSPRALFVSFCDGEASALIKALLLKEEPAAVSAAEGSDEPQVSERNSLITYKWNVETKYYSSTIDLCTLHPSVKKSDLSKSFLDGLSRVEAFIGYFDTTERGSFLLAAKCAKLMKDSNSNVKVLVCEKCISTDETSKHEVLTWCINNGFELVELNEEVEDEDEDDVEDDFQETKGIQRIIEALKCNNWSNMVLKDHKPYARQLREGLTGAAPHSSDSLDSKSRTESETETAEALGKLTLDSAGKDEDGEESDSSSSQSGAGDEQFENLFKNIPLMRQEANALPFEDRKKYAEDVVKKFWMSIGGDMSEFDED